MIKIIVGTIFIILNISTAFSSETMSVDDAFFRINFLIEKNITTVDEKNEFNQINNFLIENNFPVEYTDSFSETFYTNRYNYLRSKMFQVFKIEKELYDMANCHREDWGLNRESLNAFGSVFEVFMTVMAVSTNTPGYTRNAYEYEPFKLNFNRLKDDKEGQKYPQLIANTLINMREIFKGYHTSWAHRELEKNIKLSFDEIINAINKKIPESTFTDQDYDDIQNGIDKLTENMKNYLPEDLGKLFKNGYCTQDHFQILKILIKSL